MKRYSPAHELEDNEEDPEGMYVFFSDHVREIERLHQANHELADVAEARGEEIERLRQIIIDAPHDPDCNWWLSPKRYTDCNCWKRDALREE